MKRIFVAIFSVVLFFSNLGTSIACEFLKEQIGVVVPNIIEKYDLLDDPTNDDSGSTTYFKEYDSLSLCDCLLYTSPSPRDPKTSRMPSSA